MPKKIPFFSLERHIKKFEKKIIGTIKKTLSSQQFIGGTFVEQLEKKLSKFLNSNHVITCNSGTDALWIALKAMNIEKKDLILTTPFSFIASSSEIVAHQAHPVFIDVDKKTFNLDPIKLQSWLKNSCKIKNGITEHKKTGFKVPGILTVDIFGQCADYTQIQKIANEWNLWIIEDACQAIGSQQNGKQAGTFGDIACFSFYPTKNLGAFGDGGCCCTNNANLAEKIIKLRNHGRTCHYHYEMLGRNSRLDAIQAVILSEKLDLLDESLNNRKKIAQIYNNKLSNLKNIILPEQVDGKHVYHQYSIQAVDQNANSFRDELQKQLQEKGIETRVFYPEILSSISFLNTEKKIKTDCPVAEKLTQTILSLPIWPELTKEEALYICKSIKQIFEQEFVNIKEMDYEKRYSYFN